MADNLPLQGDSLTLWEEDEVKELLNPHTMICRDLYDGSALRRLLGGTPTYLLRQPHLLGRLVTLELLARAVRIGSSYPRLAYERYC
jgi:hypothetical protein